MIEQSRFPLGATIHDTASFYNPSDLKTDPASITLLVTKGDGTTFTWTYGGVGSIVRDAAGDYHADFVADVTGLWKAKWDDGELSTTRSFHVYTP